MSLSPRDKYQKNLILVLGVKEKKVRGKRRREQRDKQMFQFTLGVKPQPSSSLISDLLLSLLISRWEPTFIDHVFSGVLEKCFCEIILRKLLYLDTEWYSSPLTFFFFEARHGKCQQRAFWPVTTFLQEVYLQNL